MEDFVTWVDTSKLKRTIARYNDEVCMLFSVCERNTEPRLFLPSSSTISIYYDVSFTSGDPKTPATGSIYPDHW